MRPDGFHAAVAAHATRRLDGLGGLTLRSPRKHGLTPANEAREQQATADNQLQGDEGGPCGEPSGRILIDAFEEPCDGPPGSRTFGARMERGARRYAARGEQEGRAGERTPLQSCWSNDTRRLQDL